MTMNWFVDLDASSNIINVKFFHVIGIANEPEIFCEGVGEGIIHCNVQKLLFKMSFMFLISKVLIENVFMQLLRTVN